MNITIPISEYTYTLADEQIAKHPLAQREQSKLLVYQKGCIKQATFTNLPQLLPENSLLVFNNTKVIHARLLFQKESGAHIEVFMLSPLAHTFEQALAHTSNSSWLCTVGNLKRWKNDELQLSYTIGEAKGTLVAEKLGLATDGVEVRLSWSTPHTLSELVEACGKLPIPPYLNRAADESDNLRYQTVYAEQEGSVAAPTAGLHFSQPILDKLKEQHTDCISVCLHVGAGTFKPVKADTVDKHEMHSEQFTVSLQALERIRQAAADGQIIAVGTTSVRTLESLYYIGRQLINNSQHSDSLRVDQWEPYNSCYEDIPAIQAIDTLISYLHTHKLAELHAATSIMIVPGYQFKLVKGLVTNFHQPQSTLLLLIAAFIGEDWHRVYDYALANNFRFLSYGDSSLLLP